MFELADTVEGQPVRNCYSYLVLENKFHGSTDTVKIPIHSKEHEHLGNLKGEGSENEVTYSKTRPKLMR